MLRLTTHLQDAWGVGLATLPIGLLPALAAFAATSARLLLAPR